MNEITIDDFFKIDLRVAKIIEVSEIEEADKLVQLKLDLGDLGEKTVFAYSIELINYLDIPKSPILQTP